MNIDFAKEYIHFFKLCIINLFLLQEKKPTDFFKYCEYLTDFLRLIQIRREAMQNLSLRDEIDGPVKWKVAELYRLCTERFKVFLQTFLLCLKCAFQKLDFFKKELEFLKWARLFGAASRCYTKILQVRDFLMPYFIVFRLMEAIHFCMKTLLVGNFSKIIVQKMLDLFCSQLYASFVLISTYGWLSLILNCIMLEREWTKIVLFKLIFQSSRASRFSS